MPRNSRTHHSSRRTFFGVWSGAFIICAERANFPFIVLPHDRGCMFPVLCPYHSVSPSPIGTFTSASSCLLPQFFPFPARPLSKQVLSQKGFFFFIVAICCHHNRARGRRVPSGARVQCSRRWKITALVEGGIGGIGPFSFDPSEKFRASMSLLPKRTKGRTDANSLPLLPNLF